MMTTSTSMQCPECGVEVRTAMVHCRTCGARLHEDRQADVSQTHVEPHDLTDSFSIASPAPPLRTPSTSPTRGSEMLAELLDEAAQAGFEVPPPSADRRPATVEQIRQALADRDPHPLLNALQHDDERVRRLAVQALGRLVDPISVAPLYRQLREDSSENVQIAIITTLARFKDASVLMALAYALDQSEPLRLKAILALGGIPGTHAKELLIRQLTSESPTVRCYVAQALGRTGDRDVTMFLESLYRSGEPIVKRSALKALRYLGDTRSEEELATPHAHQQETENKRRWWRRAIEQSPEPDENPHTSLSSQTPAASRTSKYGLRQEEKPQKTKRPSLLTRLRQVRISRYDLIPSFLLGLSPRAQTIAGAALILIVAVTAGVNWLPGMFAGERVVIRGFVRSVSLSEDGRTLAAGRTFGLIEIWDVEKQELLDQMTDVTGELVVLDQTGTRLLAATNARTVLYDLTHQTVLAEDTGSNALSPNSGGTHVAATMTDGRLVVWDLEAGQIGGSFSFDRSDITAVAVTPDGLRIAVAAGQNEIYEVDLEQAALTREIVVPNSRGIASLAYDPGGNQLAASTREGPIHFWNGDELNPSITLMPDADHTGPLKAAFYIAPDRLLGMRRVNVDIWDVGTEELQSYPIELDLLDSVAIGKNGTVAACASTEDPEILLFDAISGQPIAKLDRN